MTDKGMFPSFEGADEEPQDEALARLQEEAERLRDARLEERFIWIVICTILIDVLWFRSVSNPALPVVVMTLEGIILLILAKRMQIDGIDHLMEKLIYGMNHKG